MAIVIPSKGHVRDAAQRLFRDELEKQLYQDRIYGVFKDLELVGSATNDNVDRVYAILKGKRIPPNAPTLRNDVFSALQSSVVDRKFSKLLREDGKDILDEFRKDSLRADEAHRLAQFLDGLGLDPEKTNDRDWARIGLAMQGQARSQRDFFSMSGLSRSTADGRDLPDFESERSIGLHPERIRKLGDLYYVHMFDRLGIFEAIDELAMRFYDYLDLGASDVAEQLYFYLRGRNLRFPDEDRRRIAGRIFDGNGTTGEFKRLLGRMVEAMVEYTRVRNTGELLSDRDADLAPSAFTRSAVTRSVQNLQRYLSSVGGGIVPFVSLDAKNQLLSAFDMLDSEELKQYAGGANGGGMLAVLDELLRAKAVRERDRDKLDGYHGGSADPRRERSLMPATDRTITLAVHGRRLFQWMADVSVNVRSLSDIDIQLGAEHVHDWLAAYRKPTMDPDWLDEDEQSEEEPVEEDIGDAAAEEALRRSGAEEADVLDT